MKKINYILMALILLVFMIASPLGVAKGQVEEVGCVDVPPDCGVVFDQVDFTFPEVTVMGSDWGRVTVDPGALAECTGMTSGYLNIRNVAGWVVSNLAIDLADGTAPVSTYFTLFEDTAHDISTLTAFVVFCTESLETFYIGDGPGEFDIESHDFPVGAWEWNAQGAGDEDVIEIGAPPPPAIELYSPPNESHVLPNPVNVQTAMNQCFPMSIANSLQFMEETYNLAVPHDHEPGQDGDDTLVGQLDELANRDVTNRCDGEGVWFAPMLEGKFDYLAANGLEDSIIHKHQGLGYGQTLPAGDFTHAGITSTNEGNTVTWEWICQQIQDGEDVELVYQHSGGGGHAVRVFGCGITEGQEWVRYLHDANQAHGDPANPQGDDAGLEVVQQNVSDSDGDGTLNLGSNGREIMFALSESVEPGIITIEKQTIPDGPGRMFQMIGDVSCFLTDDAQVTLEYQPGQIIITELVPECWKLYDIEVSDTNSEVNINTNTATINLEPLEEVTVTFYNAEYGTICVAKVTDPPGSDQEFSFGISGQEMSQGVIGDGEIWEAGCFPPGEYTITEDEVECWDVTDITIAGADAAGVDLANRQATIDLDYGEDVTVTFNNQQRGTIIVEKQTDPDDYFDDVLFTFEGDAAGAIKDDGEIIVDCLMPYMTYTSKELDKTWWDLVDIQLIGDVHPSGTASTYDFSAKEVYFALDPGEEIRAIFTNKYSPPPEEPPTQPAEGAAVGIDVYPVDKVGLLLPWAVVAGLFVLGTSTVLLVRRRINR